MTAISRPRRFTLVPTNGRLRRVSPVAQRPREGLLTEPTAGAQPRGRELGFMLVCDLGPPRRRELFAIAAIGRSGICGAFWPGIRAGYWGRSSLTANHGAL